MEGSPTSRASPTHGGATSMEELARALTLATEAATRAANAAADNVERGSSSRDLYKLLPKPNAFNPADRDQEVLQWRDWYWTLRQYLGVVDGKFLEDLDHVETHMDSELDYDLLSAEEQSRGRFLYGLLGSLVQGRLLGLIRNVSNSNGGEALRQLLMNCQPKARNRTMSLLQGIMSYPAFNMKTSILAQILRLEEHFVQYEKLGGKIGEEMKAAVLLRSLSGPLKTHLNLTLNEGSSYSKIRESINAFDTAWNEAGSLAYTTPQSDPNGLMPMEIDRVQKGKGKSGKGKGKSKDGKGKGKDFDGNKGKSKGKSDWRQDSGKGHGGKDSGGKGQKGKSKTRDKTSLACYTCGQVGHVARDCWRNVRQVTGPESTVRAGSDACSASETATTVTTVTTFHRMILSILQSVSMKSKSLI